MLPLLPLLSLFALLACPALGQINFWGNCPSPTLLSPLNTTMLTGTLWHEQKRYYSWLEGGNTCVNWKYVTSTASSLDATTTMKKWGTNTLTMMSGIEFKNSMTKRSDFWYTVKRLPGTTIPLPGVYNYQIISLTNEHLAAWSCRQEWFSHQQMLWIMTAAKHPATSVVTTALDAVRQKGLTVDTGRLDDVMQNCA